MDQHRKRRFQITGGYWLLAFAGLLFLQSALLRQAAPKDVAYSDFVASLRGGKVAKAELRQRVVPMMRLYVAVWPRSLGPDSGSRVVTGPVTPTLRATTVGVAP